jgi:hypothetical protein
LEGWGDSECGLHEYQFGQRATKDAGGTAAEKYSIARYGFSAGVVADHYFPLPKDCDFFQFVVECFERGLATSVNLGQNGESLEEAKLKEILAARTGARLKEVQADVFRVMLDWQRDVLVLASGGGEEYLLHPEYRDALARQAELQSQGSALQSMRILESMTQRLSRNIPDLQVFDEAFRQLIR